VDGDAGLEIGGFQRDIALHHNFLFAAVRVRPFFFAGLIVGRIIPRPRALEGSNSFDVGDRINR